MRSPTNQTFGGGRGVRRDARCSRGDGRCDGRGLSGRRHVVDAQNVSSSHLRRGMRGQSASEALVHVEA